MQGAGNNKNENTSPNITSLLRRSERCAALNRHGSGTARRLARNNTPLQTAHEAVNH
jgi:hypothetical protein